MVDRIAETSPRAQARIAGFLYLIVIVTGGWAQLFVRAHLIVRDDAAATAANIAAHEPLFRLGLVADLISVAAYIGVTAVLYGLLKPAGRTLSPACGILQSGGLRHHGREPGQSSRASGALGRRALFKRIHDGAVASSIDVVPQAAGLWLRHRHGILWTLLLLARMADRPLDLSSAHSGRAAGDRRDVLPGERLHDLRLSGYAAQLSPYLLRPPASRKYCWPCGFSSSA